MERCLYRATNCKWNDSCSRYAGGCCGDGEPARFATIFARSRLTHFSPWCVGIQDRKVDANPSERQHSGKLGTLEGWEKCLSRGLGEATARLLSALGMGGMLGAWRAVRTLLLAGEQELARLEAVE